MNDAVVKTCVSCAKFGGPEAEPYPVRMQSDAGPECKHPEARTRDLVYGKAFCRKERNDTKGCGPKGRLWVSKDSAKEN